MEEIDLKRQSNSQRFDFAPSIALAHTEALSAHISRERLRRGRFRNRHGASITKRSASFNVGSAVILPRPRYSEAATGSFTITLSFFSLSYSSRGGTITFAFFA